MREYLVRILTGAGYRADAVSDGLAALAAARAEAPDLIVSDVMMPLMDGLALVGALRSDTRTASVPVLLLSARAGQEASIEGLSAGADDYLVKPFAAAELLARVRANVELARLRTHHVRWRAALVDSLQEALLVMDDTGTVLEVNAAFATMLGHGPEGCPTHRTTHGGRMPRPTPRPTGRWPTPSPTCSPMATATTPFPSSIGTGTGCMSEPPSTTPAIPTADVG